MTYKPHVFDVPAEPFGPPERDVPFQVLISEYVLEDGSRRFELATRSDSGDVWGVPVTESKETADAS